MGPTMSNDYNALHRAAQMLIDRQTDTKLAHAAYVAAQHAEQQASYELRNVLTAYKLASSPDAELVNRMHPNTNHNQGTSTASQSSLPTFPLQDYEKGLFDSRRK